VNFARRLFIIAHQCIRPVTRDQLSTHTLEKKLGFQTLCEIGTLRSAEEPRPRVANSKLLKFSYWFSPSGRIVADPSIRVNITLTQCAGNSMHVVIGSQAASGMKYLTAGFAVLDRTGIIVRLEETSRRELGGHFELLVLQV
jgi:hypothetical protein